MMPDKIYVREYPDGSFNPTWETKRKDDPTTVHHEYIRKDALLEWLKEMKRICRGAEPIEKAYQTIIDKLNEM